MQPIPHPLNSPLIKSISLLLREKDVAGDCVKGPTEVQIDDIRRSPLVHRCSHSIREGCQAGLAAGEAMLAVSNHLPVLHVP